MRLEALGYTGNMGGSSVSAPGYLIELDNGRAFIIDLGPDVLTELQKISNSTACDLLLTHVHPDHTVDIPGLLVWCRFHPITSTGFQSLLVGPGDIHDWIDTMCQALGSGEDANLENTFNQVVSNPGEPLLVGRGEADGDAVVTPYNMAHLMPAIRYRIEADDLTIAYTGDIAWTNGLVELARDANIFICRVTWCSNEEDTPLDVHSTGYGAGKAATLAGVKKLVLTHIPSYADGEEALRTAEGAFTGDAELAYLGMGLGD